MQSQNISCPGLKRFSIIVSWKKCRGENSCRCNEKNKFSLHCSTITSCVKKLNTTCNIKICTVNIFSSFSQSQIPNFLTLWQATTEGGLAKGWPMREKEGKYQPIRSQLRHVLRKQSSVAVAKKHLKSKPLTSTLFIIPNQNIQRFSFFMYQRKSCMIEIFSRISRTSLSCSCL